MITPPLPPEAEAVRRRYDPAAGEDLPAHVTVLYPFLPPQGIDGTTLASLTEVIDGFECFDYRLAEARVFPGDVLFVTAEPAEPFLELTRAIVDRWPELQPYGGTVALPEIVPHVTIGHRIPEGERRRVEQRLAEWLPVPARATDISLLVHYGIWNVETVFSLA